MANPTVIAALNKQVYAPGEAMLLTVQYGDRDNQPLTVTIQVTDASGNKSDPINVTANISDALTVTVSDVDGRSWTKQSDNGSVAVYRAVA